MAAKYNDYSTRVWLETRRHEDDPTIREGDWRDEDRVLLLSHLTCYSNDLEYQESHSKSEPDWSMGVELRTDQNRTVATFHGEPPEVIKRAVLEGRILEGLIVARDYQMHG